jgi:hypothetical protein
MEGCGPRLSGDEWHSSTWPSVVVSPGGNFVEGDFRELWISEDLDVDVLFIDESQTKGKGTRAELTHIRLKEPDHSWFEIPEGVPATVRTLAKKPLPDPCSAISPDH